MEAAQIIRDSVAQVAQLRTAQTGNPADFSALRSIKGLQARRFAGTYVDLLTDARHGPASRFFLDELYSERDYAERDQQFMRIAGALQRLFPASAVATAVTMARLHLLTEQLDADMVRAWSATAASGRPGQRYVQAWRAACQRVARQQQLAMVLELGRALDQLTRKPGLRSALRLMRGPAGSAGLSTLQGFLERGFDSFAAMHGAQEFLAAIESREMQWIDLLFDADVPLAASGLERTLALAAAQT